jgi:hypothetical protein
MASDALEKKRGGGVRRIGAPHNGEEDEGRPLVWHTEEVGADGRDAQAAEPGRNRDDHTIRRVPDREGRRGVTGGAWGHSVLV